MIEKSLVIYLKSISAVSALVGDKVYPLSAKQGIGYPRIEYQALSGLALASLDSGPCSLHQARYQLSCWGETYSEAKDLARAVKGTATTQRLDGYRGWMGGQAAGNFVQSSRIENSQDDEEPPVHDDDEKLERVIFDVILWYEDRQDE